VRHHFDVRQESGTMEDDKFINQARVSFSILRWLTVVALFVLPFTYSQGTAAPTLIATALPIAFGWLASLVMAWRSRNQLWFGLAFLIVVIAPRFIGLDDPELPDPHSFQWICFLMIFSGGPLLLFRKSMLQLSHLNPTTNKPAHPTAGNVLL
jgi:hypothetical protein